MRQKIGVVDVGGGMRGIYAAGVLDFCLAAGIRKDYPLAAKRLEHRAEQYNAGEALAKRYAAQGTLLIVAPDDTCGVTTLNRDPACLSRLYEKGYRDGRSIVPFLNS